jgi:hypothetical protein
MIGLVAACITLLAAIGVALFLPARPRAIPPADDVIAEREPVAVG